MRSWIFAVAAFGSACGTVNRTPGMDASIGEPAADAAVPVTYRGMVTATDPPVMFGGAPECTYTVTLRQIDVQLGILSSGEVTSGQLQVLYDEELVGTCGHPAAAPVISSFTFASAVASGTSKTLTFHEKPGDRPGASLVIVVTPSGAGYQAKLTFHRTDLGPPLDWMVTTTTSMVAQ